VAKYYTAKELGDKHGISAQAVAQKMRRHGYSKNKQNKYSEADFLQAKALGAEMDKAGIAKQLEQAESDGESLQAQKLRRQIALLDLDIEMSKEKLLEMQGKVISLDRHKEHCQAIAQLMLTWWDQASESAATKVKNAEVLNELRRSGERARQEILDFA